MNLNGKSALRKLIDCIIPGYRPCSIVKTTIAQGCLPNVDRLAECLTNWSTSEATLIVEQMIKVNANPEELALELEAQHVDLIDEIPGKPASERTILAFTIPLITKGDRLALVLYSSNGPRSLRPLWTIGALGRQGIADEWEVLVQYHAGFAGGDRRDSCEPER